MRKGIKFNLNNVENTFRDLFEVIAEDMTESEKAACNLGFENAALLLSSALSGYAKDYDYMIYDESIEKDEETFDD